MDNNIKKWRGLDWINIFDDMASGLNNFTQPSFTLLHGEFVDTSKFDITPKKSYLEEQIKFKEKQLEDLKIQRENEKIAYENREKSLRLEIDQLRQRL
jgi:hypothetical protein